MAIEPVCLESAFWIKTFGPNSVAVTAIDRVSSRKFQLSSHECAVESNSLIGFAGFLNGSERERERTEKARSSN